MDDKQHYLTILRDEFKKWEDLVNGMRDEQRLLPLVPSHWSTKDVIAHLRAWQQRTIARLEAATESREPEFPKWPAEFFTPEGLPSEEEDNMDKINNWIYQNHRDQTWPDVHRDWHDGFSRVIQLTEAMPEKDLLEPGKYSWLWGHPLAFILTSTVEHHQEHMEWLLESLQNQGVKVTA